MPASPPIQPPKSAEKSKPRLSEIIGPGLITGASDDDPSGIATYSQAGAQFGYGLSWTMVVTFPLMSAVQMISARIGRASGRGIAGNLRRHYPRWLTTLLVLLLLTANTINIGADLGAMADATRLVTGLPSAIFLVLFAIFCAAAEVILPYAKYARVLKWLTLALFAYVITLFMVKISWAEALTGLVIPKAGMNAELITMIVAIFGTTISPYLFFWQASEEAEEVESHRRSPPLAARPGGRRERAQADRARHHCRNGGFEPGRFGDHPHHRGHAPRQRDHRYQLVRRRRRGAASRRRSTMRR